MLLHVQRVRVSQINGQAESGCTRSFARTTWESHLPNPIHFRLSVVLIWSTLDDTKVASLVTGPLQLVHAAVGELNLLQVRLAGDRVDMGHFHPTAGSAPSAL